MPKIPEMGQKTEQLTLHLFDRCTVPAFWVARPAGEVLTHTTKVEERATPSPSAPQLLNPPPVLIQYSDTSEEPLNPHVAVRHVAPLRPETLIGCALVDPTLLNPPELIELVEFRFRHLDPIYNPKSRKHTSEECKAVLRDLAESDSLRSLILRYFFPQENQLSLRTMEAFLANAISYGTVKNYVEEIGAPPFPWDSTPQPLPAVFSLQPSHRYWEKYRKEKDPSLPSFEDAIRIFFKNRPDNPYTEEEGMVYGHILPRRLSTKQSKKDAFNVIASFLEETSHLLEKSSQESPHEETIPTEEDPTGGAWSHPPGAGLGENQPIDLTPADPVEPEEEFPIPWALEDGSPAEKPSYKDPLLPRIQNILEENEKNPGFSMDFWVGILELAKYTEYNNETSLYDRLVKHLDNENNNGTSLNILRKFFSRLETKNGKLY